MSYAEDEVRRIAHVGFRAAQGRKRRLCRVDKANVLETSQLWRDVVIEVAAEYPDVALEPHVRRQRRDAAGAQSRASSTWSSPATCSATSCPTRRACASARSACSPAPRSASDRPSSAPSGLYEPIHGSAPDIAGQGKANPMATILSAAMMLRHSFGREAEAARIEAAVAQTLADGVRGARPRRQRRHRAQIGDAVLARL